MAKNYKIICNAQNENSIGMQFASDGGTPLFTLGNFRVDTVFTEKEDKTYNVGEISQYYTLEDLGDTTTQENLLKINKTKLKLNQDYSNPKTYSYFGSLTEYFRVNIEQIITNWPASIYVNKISGTITGNTVENYIYDPITNKSNFSVNNTFFNNTFDIKYTTEYFNSEGVENKLRNLNLEYGSYTIFYDNVEYPIINFTGSTSYYNDTVYFEVNGNPFNSITGSTLSTNYHIKPNSIEVEKFFSSLSDLGNQLLNRYIFPKYTVKFNYFSESDQGPFDFYVSRVYTWPVNDGYNLDIVTDSFDTYLSSLYEFSDYFDQNDTNIMNRQLVSESINSLNTIRRTDGSEEESDADKMTKLINIYAREFDEVKKYIDGLSYIRNVSYDKKSNTPDTLIKDNARTMGWSLLTPMSDVDLISSFIPTNSVYSGYTSNFSKYDAEIEFWRRLIINTSYLWKSKGSRKAIEFLFNFIGTPEQLVNFNEHIYMAKKPLNIDLFKTIIKEIFGSDDLTAFNIDENGFPKLLPQTSYNYYQSNGLWYRETAGSNSSLDILQGNNPHIGPYDGGDSYVEQFKCLLDITSGYTQVSGNSITIKNDTIEFTNLFKNYSQGLFNNYNGQIYLESFNIDSKPNTSFNVTGTVITDPDPEYVLGLCGCPIDLVDQALLINIRRNNFKNPCNGQKISSITEIKPEYELTSSISQPPILIFSSNTNPSVQLIPKEFCKSNTNSSNYISTSPLWVEVENGLGYCYWDYSLGNVELKSSDEQGNLIFLNKDNGLTGKTSIEVNSDITSSCTYLGGEYDVNTGYCKIVNQSDSVSGEFGHQFAPIPSGCQLTPLKDLNDEIILNNDGTISFVDSSNTIQQTTTLECCNSNSTKNLPLTFCNGKCYWLDNKIDYEKIDDLKVTIGIDGNDGIFILQDSNEICNYQVEFDMLINFDCEKFSQQVNNNTILQSLSAFTVNATIESVSGNTPNTIQTYSAYNFNINNKPTGIYFSGQDSICQSLKNQILLQLSGDCQVVTSETFEPKWVNVKFLIDNQFIGQKIKIGFNFNNIPCEFNFLLDDIKINKVCTITNKDIINLTSCIGFDIERVVDNKKSWVFNEENEKRVLDYLDYRETSYSVKNDKLIINSKEVDLSLDPSRAIDNDVLCYLRKNSCFFTGNTGTTISDPYLSNYKEEIDLINDVNEFREFVLTRLIDVKSRKVINSYPLIRYVYDKYLNLCGLNECENLGNQYDYDSLNNFIKLIGDYWIELVEQLVPSTSIWKGATRFYRNTIFDQPKFKYKKYSLKTCEDVCTTMISGTSTCELMFTPTNLYNLNLITSKLTNYSELINDITDCWEIKYTDYNLSISSGAINVPDTITTSINSSGNTINSVSIYMNGYLDGNIIFNNLIISGNSYNQISGVTFNDYKNSLENSLTSLGYNVSYSGDNVVISSALNSNCGKKLEIGTITNLSLSAITANTCTEYTEIDKINNVSSYSQPINTSAEYCISGDTLYVIDVSSKVMIYSGDTNLLVGTIQLPKIGSNLTIHDSVYNVTNNSIYILQVYPLSIIKINCSDNSYTTHPVTELGISQQLFNKSRMVLNPTTNKIYYPCNVGLIEFDCFTNNYNIINVSDPYYTSQITYCSGDNKIYITKPINQSLDTYDGVNYVSNVINFSFKPTGISYNPIKNRLYITSSHGISLPIIVVDPINNIITKIINQSQTSTFFNVFYEPYNSNILLTDFIDRNMYGLIDDDDNLTYINSSNSIKQFIINSKSKNMYGIPLFIYPKSLYE